jgi:Protein of unknown function (DUF1878)
VSSLEDRVDLIEYQLELITKMIQDPKHSHFNKFVIERRLSRAEVNRIFGLMDMISENPTATDEDDFLSKLGDLIPGRKVDSNFASSILKTLNSDGKYENVYEYLKDSDASLGLE